MIPVHNIYYMLSYAFQILTEDGYKNIACEHFENTAELFAAILYKGISIQLKRGLNRDYTSITEPLSAVKGKIDITQSIKTQSVINSQLVCTYDEFSENSYLNKILKATVLLLLKADITTDRKKQLKRIAAFFANIDTLDVRNINWRFHYNKSNKSYHLLICICNLVIKGLLQTQQDGTTKMMNYLDEQRMCRLYEKFILEYYRKHHSEVSANAEQIEWQLDDGKDDMLPIMQTDITLKKGNEVLIIDAKYYSHTMQSQFDKKTLHSNNLYQLFTYVKNKEYELRNKTHRVSGMLLYAKTDEEIQPDNIYLMSGNTLSVKTLDLNVEFCEISRQLDKIFSEYFG